MADSSAKRWSKTVLIYTAFSLLPIYWLIILSFQPNGASEQSANLWPDPISLENYLYIFSQDNWIAGYRNAVIYVSMNIVFDTRRFRSGGLRVFALSIPWK